MDISDASTFFDDDPVYDAYTGTFLWNAQVSSFNDSHSDGATNRRRVMSTGPGLAMPARQVIQLYGDRWLSGPSTPDGFQGVVTRQNFNMKRATDLMTLLTPGQALSGAAGTQAWVHKFYFKDDSDAMSSAEIDTFWNIFVAPGEPVAKGSFMKDANGRFYRVRNDYLPVEGLRVCQSDSLDVGSRMAATFNVGSYDPISDSYGPASAPTTVIAVELPKFYRFRYMSDPALQKGDMAVFVPSTIAVKQGAMFTMGGKQWRIMTVQAELDCNVIHARLA